MCVIAISKKGIRQPTIDELRDMWDFNPHGGGYMSIRNGLVEIHKGFMCWNDFIRSVKSEHFTNADPVVYHFRISTQGGITPQMTHPFPLSKNPQWMKALDVICHIGIAHNGIIPLTTDKTQTEYSDTALFITEYLSEIIRSERDLRNPKKLKVIEALAQSKLAIMTKKGDIYTVGKFYEQKSGIILSNENHLFDYSEFYKQYCKKGANKSVYNYTWEDSYCGV